LATIKNSIIKCVQYLLSTDFPQKRVQNFERLENMEGYIHGCVFSQKIILPPYSENYCLVD